MARGNQREVSREKAQKKLAAQSKPHESGVSKTKRMERDAEIVRAKQAAAAAKKAQEAAQQPK
ncbi:uncharacterized protein L969DRAFT_18279 [Mixia osmundae IAM 14324]|uniref:Small EDRK-rich factor-like N-terminal domain-containing protein n=1 Tax=Mixia osmundae (strain CBS 9802 / IAM 14324 / JCM 22182 / KY 12970) TaxID=764103 RepID=G7DZ48_MIXOS|nr:uncharacterized protein L969DRAFT_18279 [Mixia osmundae IAM 14324]KEI38258.1 hypothetical protein L969DRAFT_18279 [Mixia osmundae IAM 14324]GAA95858.1 hypothetical protein E5Q_02515 [Mixia osmundae IAM 14324]